MAWTERDRLVWGFLEALKPEEDCVLLLTGRTTPQERLSYLFLRPQQVITCRDMAQIESSLQALERALEEGYYLAGFLSYEAGFAFERGFVHPPKGSFPLLWFGVYDQPIIFDHGQGCFINPRSPGTTPPFPSLEPPEGEGYSLEGLTLSVPKDHYVKAIQAVRDYIAQGQTYQVNYTLKCRFSFSGSPYRFFLDLSERQHVSYAAFLKFGSHLALSLSPELFFRKRGRNMVVRPMKGTWQRGRTGPEDAKNAQKLASSLKNRAENVMIVDLLRNDLGRLSEVGSVQTTRLFDVERYDTLLQMTSTIESKLRPGVSLYELFAKIFPCGSITGAPKIRTMQIIHELEHEPRRIYTGSIGYISPHGNAVFNVAIRTLLLDARTGQGEMGIGGGIVYDSHPEEEYQECLLKARFLTSPPVRFQLLETMLWKEGSYFLLKLHLERLRDSAAYFDFHYDEEAILQLLEEKAEDFQAGGQYRVRILLDRCGGATLEVAPVSIESLAGPKKAALSSHRTSSSDAFLYHKTTHRPLYDDEYRKYAARGFFDVLFRNERGELTEGAISNLFIKKDGRLYTPPISSGLLPGTYRRHLLEEGLLPVEEKVLFIDDLLSTDEVYLVNSVRGMVQVAMDTESDKGEQP